MKKEFSCRVCGAAFAAGTAQCPSCGRALDLGLQRQPATPEEKQSATGFLAAMLIGLIIGGILYLMITG